MTAPEADAQAMPPLDILLAEDNPVNQMIIKALLSRRGHRVTLVPDGATALAEASARHFDIILMDMNMPVMDGLAATRGIRALPEPFGSVPVIALSADTRETEAKSCLQAGMNALLAKPVDAETLSRVIAAHTGAAPAEAAPVVEADLIFDRPRFDACLRLMGSDGINEVCQRFDALIADLDTALSNLTVPEDKASLAHSVAGCASYLGLQRLTTTCRAFEKALRGGDDAEAARFATELPRLIEASRRSLP